MGIWKLLKGMLGKVGDEAAYDVLKRVIFGGGEDKKEESSETEGEKSPKIRIGGRLESGDETGYEAAIAELTVAERANVEDYCRRKLNHNQYQRLRVLITLLRQLRDVYIEREPVAVGTDSKGKVIYRDRESRKVHDPAVNALKSWAIMSDEEKDKAFYANGVLTGDDEWIEEQKAKAKSIAHGAEEKAVQAAELVESTAKQLFFRALTLGMWGGPKD